MALTLEVPDELEVRLTQKATQLGVPVEQYALRLLDGPSEPERRPRTGAELVEYWRSRDLIGSRPDIADSQAYAREMRRRAETRN